MFLPFRGAGGKGTEGKEKKKGNRDNKEYPVKQRKQGEPQHMKRKKFSSSAGVFAKRNARLSPLPKQVGQTRQMFETVLVVSAYRNKNGHRNVVHIPVRRRQLRRTTSSI